MNHQRNAFVGVAARLAANKIFSMVYVVRDSFSKPRDNGRRYLPGVIAEPVMRCLEKAGRQMWEAFVIGKERTA